MLGLNLEVQAAGKMFKCKRPPDMVYQMLLSVFAITCRDSKQQEKEAETPEK